MTAKKKGREHAIGITAETSEMKRERVEDGSCWHNEKEKTSGGGYGRREKIPARKRARSKVEAWMGVGTIV